ncbi:MAG: tyrosine-type recombinase/integrase [Candidatus Aenigmatarchaeota archaeon]
MLNDFFRKARSGGDGDATLSDYASRFNKLAEVVDFPLDDPEQQDLERVVNAFNTDSIKKNNGETYSGYSKDKFSKTLSKFYNGFIKKQGKGYNPDIDGPELLEDLEINASTSTKVDPDQLPTPDEVRKVANHANSLRDKALILFGWATGGRVGEMFVTDYDEDPIRWEDITFQEDRMWVKISEEGKNNRGKSEDEREVPVKTSIPAIRELWESMEVETFDPVFSKRDRTYYCPECGTKTTSEDRTSYEKRVYKCRSDDCSWKGGNETVEKRREPLTDDAVRRILERCTERAGLTGEFTTKPHDFFRKSRAIYKARIGYTEHQMRAFFGWSETSDAPKHYIELTREDLEKAFAEEHGEEVDYDNGHDEDALRPIQCVKCDTLKSSTNDMCKECGNALSEQGEKLTRDSSSQSLQDSLVDVLARRLAEEDPAEDVEEIEDMVENKSIVELLQEVS